MAYFGDVLIQFRFQCGTLVNDIDIRGHGSVMSAEVNVDEYGLHLRDNIGVLQVSGLKVECGVNPDGGGMPVSVLNEKHLALHIARRSRVKEQRIPLFSGPCPLLECAKEWRHLFKGRIDRELELVLDVSDSTCGNSRSDVEIQDDADSGGEASE
jgi:hypothetical protein